MFVELAGAQERERRMGEILNRLGSLSEDQTNKLQTLLNTQRLVNSATDPSSFPVNGDPDSIQRSLNSALAGRTETLRSNMTQVLGYSPSDSDVKELLKIQESFGGSITQASNIVAKNINQVEGGISKFLQAIDSGITEGITAVTSNINSLVEKTQQELANTVQGLLPSANSILPTGAASQFQAFLGDTNQLISKLTDSVNSQLNSVMKDIDSAFADLSNEINTSLKGIANSNIISDVTKNINQTISSTFNSVPTAPIPLNTDGQIPGSLPLNPPTDVSSAPITLPRNDPTLQLDAASQAARQAALDQALIQSRQL